METANLALCLDVEIPVEFTHSMIKAAIDENPENRKVRTSPFEAAGIRSKLWRPGRVLEVYCIHGLPEIHQRVETYARRWSDYANITFAFVDNPDADIRISFMAGGSWSAIGTDALVREYFKPHQPTMNFGWLHPGLADEEFQRVVLHEFGHALGLVHEHQNPDGGIQWNEALVLQAYSGPPNNWDEETIRRNILDRYSRDQTQYTKFDPDSIMLYSFSADLTTNRQATKRNVDLSKQDKDFVALLYPYKKDDPAGTAS